MKYLALGLLLLGGALWIIAPFSTSAQAAQPYISNAEADFSIVLFPDTQYYYGQNAHVFQDQANWVVSHQSALNIKMVIGLGDIIDGGGYPVDNNGTVTGLCGTAPNTTWQSQWQNARA